MVDDCLGGSLHFSASCFAACLVKVSRWRVCLWGWFCARRAISVVLPVPGGPSMAWAYVWFICIVWLVFVCRCGRGAGFLPIGGFRRLVRVVGCRGFGGGW